jgi:hypothetical protein
MKHILLFHFLLSWDTYVLVQCTAVNIRFLITIFKECSGYALHIKILVVKFKTLFYKYFPSPNHLQSKDYYYT